MPRELTMLEVEIMYRQAANRVADRLFADCTKQLLPLRSQTYTEITMEDHKRLMDIACLSILSNFILQAVHPLGRDQFLKDLAAGIVDLTNRAAKVTDDGKIILQ